MPPYAKKFIITGAPGTGKTTLINALEKQYPCLHEVSRKVIASEQEKGRWGMPWEDVCRFTELVYEASIIELEANPQALFTDRSMLDLIAYLKLEGKSIPKSIENYPYHKKFYDTVFFAPTWLDIYQQDEQRVQTFDYCLEFEKALLSSYNEKGFKRLIIPKVSPEKRAEFVIRVVKNEVLIDF